MPPLERTTYEQIEQIDRSALSGQERIYTVGVTTSKQDPQIIRAEISLRNLESA